MSGRYPWVTANYRYRQSWHCTRFPLPGAGTTYGSGHGTIKELPQLVYSNYHIWVFYSLLHCTGIQRYWLMSPGSKLARHTYKSPSIFREWFDSLADKVKVIPQPYCSIQWWVSPKTYFFILAPRFQGYYYTELCQSCFSSCHPNSGICIRNTWRELRSIQATPLYKPSGSACVFEAKCPGGLLGAKPHVQVPLAGKSRFRFEVENPCHLSFIRYHQWTIQKLVYLDAESLCSSELNTGRSEAT